MDKYFEKARFFKNCHAHVTRLRPRGRSRVTRGLTFPQPARWDLKSDETDDQSNTAHADLPSWRRRGSVRPQCFLSGSNRNMVRRRWHGRLRRRSPSRSCRARPWHCHTRQCRVQTIGRSSLSDPQHPDRQRFLGDGGHHSNPSETINGPENPVGTRALGRTARSTQGRIPTTNVHPSKTGAPILQGDFHVGI